MAKPNEALWFEVSVTLKIRADDESAAISRAADAIRHGYSKAAGVFPVGSFNATPTTSPLMRGSATETGQGETP